VGGAGVRDEDAMLLLLLVVLPVVWVKGKES